MRPNYSHPDGIGKQTEYTRSKALGAALAFAERGKPVFPCRHAPAKTPLTTNGFHDATTDASRVHAFWTRHPGASIGVVAGEESGWWILDVDRLDALGELGLELPPTLTVRTPSGGLHLYFKHDPRIGGNGRGRLPQGIDVRGGGRGYALIPPSPGYVWEVREEIAVAPEWLIEMIAGPKSPKPPRRNDAQPTLDLGGPPILEGTRHGAMLSLAGRLQDGSRTAEDIRRGLLSINVARCTPPLPMDEVEAIARWASERDPCSSGRPAELVALIDRLGAEWFRLVRRGLGGKNEVRFARVLLEEGTRVGTVVEDGLRISISLRQISEKLSCSLSTVVAVRDRLVEKSLLRLDRSDLGRRTATGTASAAIVLIDAPATYPVHPTDSLPSRVIGKGVPTSSRTQAAALETAHFRHRGPVGYSREDSLCWIESHPGATREELAALMGWSRARDLERLHLRPLAELGLIEEREGRWTISDMYAERQQDVIHTAFSTIQMRSARQWDPEAGRYVHFVTESGSVASQAKRDEWDIERHRQQRSLWKLALDAKKAAAEESCQPGRVIVEHDGYLVDAETGEVLGVAVQTGWDPDETTDRTAVA